MAKDCWLKRRREQLNMSQHDIALKLGLTAGAIGQWERYVSAPAVRLVSPLARALQCSEEKVIAGIAEIARVIDANRTVAVAK